MVYYTQVYLLFFLLKKEKVFFATVSLLWMLSLNVSAQTTDIDSAYNELAPHTSQLDSNEQIVKESIRGKVAPKNHRQWQQLYQHISEVAEKKENLTAALKYYKLATEIKDSLQTHENQKLTQKLKKSTAQENSPQQKADNQNELILQKKLRNVFIYFFIVILLIAFFLYRTNRQKAKANKRLLEQNLAMIRQREKIIHTQKELEKNNRLLELHNYEIKLKNDEIQEQNQDVKDSIEYAQRIQSALLPSSEKLNDIIRESFVLLKPKDIVSGDFYWVYQEEEKIILAAIDCTGHGVPGAFMSLIAKQLLDDIVIQQKIMQPADILNQLHEKIRNSLNQAESDNKDGMDMTLCLIDTVHKKVTFAGAYNPMIVIQNDDLNVIKGDSFPIGGWHFQGSDRAFRQIEVALNPDQDTMIYLYSDGYQDQFGGGDDRKFMKSRFRKLLQTIHQKPLKQQKEILNQTIEDWKGKHPQVDDILVIGLKLNAKGDFI